MAILSRMRDAAARTLTVAQGSSLYRLCSRRLAKGVSVVEATSAQEARVRARPSTAGHPVSGRLCRVTCFVALRGDAVVGWAYLQRCGEEALLPGHALGGLYVRRRWRSAGIGRLLTVRVIDEAWRQGAESVALYVSDRNLAAMAVYRGLGFALDVVATEDRRRRAPGGSAVQHLCILRLTRSA